MEICIICRELKDKMTDEHVIPESINGYYHIYKVCKSCNSILGEKVDSKLVNHKFIQFERHISSIKGKSGTIPNPFSGTHHIKDEKEQKVIIKLGDNGQLIPQLLPKVPDKIRPGEKILITIDASDIHLKEKIIEKVLNRNGIDKSQVSFNEKRHSERPWIESKMIVDIKDFRIGLLKICYEFAVDSIDQYFIDPFALVISKILLSADVKEMEEKIIFFGNGFEKNILTAFSNFIDFKSDNHYIILTSISGSGLICLIKIFNCFSIAIKLSDSDQLLADEDTLIGINDSASKNFEKLTIGEIINRVYSIPEYRFQYWLQNPIDVFKLYKLQENENFGFYKEENEVPFFNELGEILYPNINQKLSQRQLEKIDKGDFDNTLITEIILDENLYIKLLPTLDLYKVVSVQIEQTRIKKL